MKAVFIICALVVVVAARPEETYSTQYDDFDTDELVKNIRLLKNYMKCFLEKGPCTSEGSEFRKIIPDAVKTDCAKCTPKQQQMVRTVVKAMQEKLPELWAELVKKHDPHGTYARSFNVFIKGSN